MKSILFLSYYYSPVNNAGTQRIEKFVKYLPDFGYHPFVLTTTYFKPVYERITSFRLARKRPQSLRREQPVFRAQDLRSLILRSGKQGKGGISGYRRESYKSWRAFILNLIKTWLLFPDPKITWLPCAFFKALWLIKKYRVEYVFSSFPPATTHLLAYFLKKCTYVQWIADFRDGWCLDPLDPMLRHSPARLFLEKHLERLIAGNCDQILVTSPDVGKYFARQNKVSLLTNGFDPEDFLDARNKIKRWQNLQEFFVITHPGAFHFSHPGNTPYYFLKALKGAFALNPEMRKRTKVFLLGNLTSAEKKLPHKLGLGTKVKVLGLRSHQEAIQYRLISDLLLLIDRPTQKRSSYIHGKVFEHLASHKPILALLPKDSAARDFLDHLGVAKIIEPQDVARIQRTLLDSFAEWQRGGILQYELTDQELKQFERKNLTQKLVKILERV